MMLYSAELVSVAWWLRPIFQIKIPKIEHVCVIFHAGISTCLKMSTRPTHLMPTFPCLHVSTLSCLHSGLAIYGFLLRKLLECSPTYANIVPASCEESRRPRTWKPISLPKLTPLSDYTRKFTFFLSRKFVFLLSRVS